MRTASGRCPAGSSAGLLGHNDHTRSALLIRREPKFGDRAQSSLLDQVHELVRPPFVRRPTNGHTSVGLGAHRVFVADVCCGDEVSAWLQRAPEQGENLRKDLTGEVEQRPPPEHAAKGRFTKVEIGGRGDAETALRMKSARVLDHARREIHPRHVKPAFGKVGGHRSGSAPDVEDRPKLAHGVCEDVD
jgi:hypothetical protein